jgi:SAM-dependent methyltransferase
MVWRATDPCGDESAKIRWELPQYTRGRGLDLGCGPSKTFPHFIGVDNYTDTQLFGIQMKPDVVCNVTKLDVFGSASMDFVFSSHCLEHVQDHKGALKEWWRVIRPGGHLCLYLPHKEFYPNIGTEGANPDHKHDFMPADIVDAMIVARGRSTASFRSTASGQTESTCIRTRRPSPRSGLRWCVTGPLAT